MLMLKLMLMLVAGYWWFSLSDKAMKTALSSHVCLSFQLDQWPRFIAARFQYTIYPITFSVGDAEEWKKLFKPCAAQRLFLPVRLRRLHSAFNTFVLIDDFTLLSADS